MAWLGPFRRLARSVEARGVAETGRLARRRLGERLHARRRRPRTLPSRLGSGLERLRDPRPPLHVFHIGKTGGTALKHVLLEHADDARLRLLLHGHDVTLAHVPRGERFAFVLRNPVERFVSAFTGRFRGDRPRYRYSWTEEESIAFEAFETPEQLALALSSEDLDERARAERAMQGIAHLNTPYRFWFGGLESFQRRLSDVFFIGFQERLDEDFEQLKRKLALPGSARLPTDPVVAHRSVGPTAELGTAARANLERWYEEDLAFVGYCRELAPLVNLEESHTGARRKHVAGKPAPPQTRRIATRLVLPPLVGLVAFAATAALVEAFTDRDWSLSGLEWPADFVTAAVLVCLVPVVLSAVSFALRLGRGRMRAADRSGEEARKSPGPAR